MSPGLGKQLDRSRRRQLRHPHRSRIAPDIARGGDKEDLVVERSLELRCPARSLREAGSHAPVPGVPGRTGRTGTSPGRALVPYRRTGAPAVDDACTARRTMTTGPAPVRGAGRAKAGNDDEKSRDQKGSHLLSSKPLLSPQPPLESSRAATANSARAHMPPPPPPPPPPPACLDISRSLSRPLA
jgi:hypothetical protein